jgi:hypothetical protein
LLSEGDLKIAKDKLNTKVLGRVLSPRYSWGKRSDWNQEAIEIAEKVINSVI